MSAVLGIDLSTTAIELVLIDEDTGAAAWDHLELRGETALDRLRDVPRRMPRWASRWYDDAGVYLVAIEAPFDRGHAGALAKLSRVFGTVAACVPPNLQLWEVAPHEWRHELGVRGNAPKPECAAAVLDLYPAIRDWNWTQDALDALAVAHYALTVNQRGLDAA